MNQLQAVDEIEVAAMRSALYKLLARSFLYPTPAHFRYLTGDAYDTLLDQLLSIVGTETGFDGELARFTSEHRGWKVSQSREELEGEYNRLFAHLGSTQCPPYETEYGFDNIYQKTEAMADISGFYAAYGLEVSTAKADRPDFLGTELEFMSFLSLKEVYALEHNEREHLETCRETQKKFLTDHLGRWVGVFAKILSQSTSNVFYAGLGSTVVCLVNHDVERYGLTVQRIEKPGRAFAKPPMPLQCDGCGENSNQFPAAVHPIEKL